MPGTVLSTGDTVMKKTKSLSQGAYILKKNIDNKQMQHIEEKQK